MRAWQQHRQQIDQITNWTLAGRIVVNTNDDGWNGDLHWSQRKDGYGIQFSAPFGQGAFQLASSETGVEMQFSNGKTYQAVDAESLLLEQTGWNFPLHGFQYWAVGLPIPGSESKLEFDHNGRLARMRQKGWLINYREYTDTESAMMPRKVFLENEELSVRLVIDRWNLGEITGEVK